MPTRIFTVTGIPYLLAAFTDASTIAENNFRLYGRAAPPPRFVTLGTGHPKFKSM
jgi:hypothetical protein